MIYIARERISSPWFQVSWVTTLCQLLKYPLFSPQTKLLTQYVLSLAKYDQNYDIRDRARFTRQLIVPSEQGGALSRHAKKLFLAPKPAPILESSFKGGSRNQITLLGERRQEMARSRAQAFTQALVRYQALVCRTGLLFSLQSPPQPQLFLSHLSACSPCHMGLLLPFPYLGSSSTFLLSRLWAWDSTLRC